LKYVLFFPFIYFYKSRLSKGSIGFHLIFEWVAAIILVILLGESSSWLENLSRTLCHYFLFLSCYEIGYIINDSYDASRDPLARQRLPADGTLTWAWLWISSRVGFFFLGTLVLGAWQDIQWWAFYGALFVIFLFHNLVLYRELKVISFFWLAWYRFMAPIVFVIIDEQVFGIGFAAAMGYVIFRHMSYLDSKNVLFLPERRSIRFSLIFFLFPLASIGFVVKFPFSEGYVILTSFWALASLIGSAIVWFNKRLKVCSP